MSFAWEVTREDIANILRQHEVSGDAEAILEEHFDEAACDRVEEAVLQCDDFDDQAEAAFEEIETILVELGIVTR